jgi:glycosyltransferase involved in cell wall biosynthesis
VDTLRDQLVARGHEAMLVRIPFPATLDHKVLSNILSCRNLSFDEADKVIAFKFPAYFVRHSNKTLWMFHQLRQVYELWDTDYGLRPTPDNNGIRDVVTRSDDVFLREARKIYVNSREVAGRLQRFNGIQSEVLYPPLLDRELCHFRAYGDFLFYPSRITNFKRQHLAIEAMSFTKTPVRLVLAGKCEEEGYEERLQQLIDRHGLKDRVVMLGWIEQQEKFRLMADALACIYLPYKEDSYGFVSMEAFYSRKTVVTAEDSGGTSELIENGVNGYVVAPDPELLAQKFDALYADRGLARELGENAYSELTSRDISWDTVIERLLA